MKNILIIVGSLRKDGFNYNLAKEIQDKIVKIGRASCRERV